MARSPAAASPPRVKKLRRSVPSCTAAVAAAADAPFWDERQKWLDATMPPRGDSGQAHRLFLEQLADERRERGLALASPVLLKPERVRIISNSRSRFKSPAPIRRSIDGSPGSSHRKNFNSSSILQIAPQSTHPPRMTGTVTIARLFKP